MTMRSPSYDIYFDFDNTIVPFDVLDRLIERFAMNKDWIKLEEAWSRGEIGSRECLEGQMSLLRVDETGLEAYLADIRVDPAFPKILKLLERHNLEPVIVSDNFTFIILTILENNGITGLKVFCNEMHFKGDQVRVSFPFYKALCDKCGNCKTSHLIRHNRPGHTRKVYVGDGKSDVCPAGFSEVVFAKDSLLKHCRSVGKECIPFIDLGVVYQFFEKELSHYES